MFWALFVLVRELAFRVFSDTFNRHGMLARFAAVDVEDTDTLGSSLLVGLRAD